MWWVIHDSDLECVHLFLHLRTVKHFHVEGAAAACDDELFRVMLSAFLLFHNTAQG
jgi:hypothetical protein